MCSSHRPEAGADSGDIWDALADYLVVRSFLDALKDECPLCHGRGYMIGGDEEVDCPKCKGTGTA